MAGSHVKVVKYEAAQHLSQGATSELTASPVISQKVDLWHLNLILYFATNIPGIFHISSHLISPLLLCSQCPAQLPGLETVLWQQQTPWTPAFRQTVLYFSNKLVTLGCRSSFLLLKDHLYAQLAWDVSKGQQLFSVFADALQVVVTELVLRVDQGEDSFHQPGPEVWEDLRQTHTAPCGRRSRCELTCFRILLPPTKHNPGKICNTVCFICFPSWSVCVCVPVTWQRRISDSTSSIPNQPYMLFGKQGCTTD